MTITEWNILFEVFLDKIDSEALPEFTDEEKDVLYNEAIERFVKNRYSPKTIQVGKQSYVTDKGFEQSQKRIDDLRTLVQTVYPTITGYPYAENAYRADLTDLYVDEALTTPSTSEYYFFTRINPLVSNDVCSKYINKTKLVEHDDLNYVLDDPFNKPTGMYPVMYFEDSDIILLVGDNYTVDACRVTCIKKPIQVNSGTYGSPLVECDLPEHTHREIIQLAVQIGLEGIESPRQQTNVQNIQSME